MTDSTVSHSISSVGTGLSDDRIQFEAVFRDGWPVVYRYLRGMLGPDHDLESAAADAFEIAWRKRDQIPGPPGSIPWLIGVARHVALNELRATRRRIRLVEKLTQLVSSKSSSDGLEAVGRIHACATGPASQALQLLSPRDREILILSVWGEMSVAEISDVLNISLGSTSKRLYRARSRLADSMTSSQQPTDTNISSLARGTR